MTIATELDICRAIALGLLPSPTEFTGSAFFAVQFSGTGTAWRPALKEFVYRDPRIWLGAEMQMRAVGVPVIAEHPAGKMDGDEFYNRIVGITLLSFIKGDELWSVIRVIDKRAADILASGKFDTSPAVIFSPNNQNVMIPLDDGGKILVEGIPNLMDHLALVDMTDGNAGIWSKGGSTEPGVLTDNHEDIAA